MRPAAEPRDGWAHLSVVGGQQERFVGPAAGANLDAALAGVDGGGGPDELVDEGMLNRTFFGSQLVCAGQPSAPSMLHLGFIMFYWA